MHSGKIVLFLATHSKKWQWQRLILSLMFILVNVSRNHKRNEWVSQRKWTLALLEVDTNSFANWQPPQNNLCKMHLIYCIQIAMCAYCTCNSFHYHHPTTHIFFFCLPFLFAVFVSSAWCNFTKHQWARSEWDSR